MSVEWVPGHCGVKGNERVDGIAKAGARRDLENPTKTYSHMRRAAKESALASWKATWEEIPIGRYYAQA